MNAQKQKKNKSTRETRKPPRAQPKKKHFGAQHSPLDKNEKAIQRSKRKRAERAHPRNKALFPFSARNFQNPPENTLPDCTAIIALQKAGN